MNISKITNIAIDKSRFKTLSNFLDFADRYLTYIESNLQAIIISQNENHYRFYQYSSDAEYQITRPINSRLMYDYKEFCKIKELIFPVLKNVKDIKASEERQIINRIVYTMQMSIGASLDALPAGQSNTARKIAGDLFERLILLIIKETGINCASGTIKIPILLNNEVLFNMNYQHDIIVKKDEEIKLIGSIKTSSKDRIDKIFIDKFLYNKLTETNTPHIAIFLNDVQRKNTRKENEYGINSTFLSGHFRVYTVKLNPLDGVYYCDIRPNMIKEDILKDHIKTFDYFLCEDIWNFI